MKPVNNRGSGAPDDDKRLLISRAAELSARSENIAVASSFLTPAEQRTVYDALGTSRLFFWGGYIGAERREAIFLPSWLDTDGIAPAGLFSEERERSFLSALERSGMSDILSDFVTPMSLHGSGYVKLTHRDFLGSLMALGVKRSVIGDILTDGRNGYMFVEKTCAGFFETELSRVGRDTVSCKVSDAPKETQLSQYIRFTDVSATVASMRADGVVRALCNVSRETAGELITSGQTEINYESVTEPDKKVQPGDIISVRGYGKFIIDRAGDRTKRSRIRLEARKYI